MWQLVDDLDPEALKRTKPSNEERQSQKDREGIDAIVRAFDDSEGLTRRKLREATGFSPDRLNRLIATMKRNESIEIVPIATRGNPAELIRLTG